MSIFEAYDSEFSALSQDISKNISEFRSYSSNAEKSSNLVKHVDALLIQAGDLVKQMEVEIRSHDAATRKVLSDKIAQYKKSLASLRSDFEKARMEAQRASLVGDKSAADRSRYVSANEKLNRQNETIMNAQRSVAETEDVALEITQELGRNREKIESAQGKVHEFAGMTDTARRLIHSMSKREVQQKFILVFIALILIGAIGFVIYYTTK
eukprot:CAMPEP_0185018686 /NCGR_PEP_ID=MMETSP1103-20130426/1352_1 /TAXON_ID=36769 /ORGANISM="Paraphysomonas bandaiensis, Strain Caron Lab Isolate" /LENGTH=210 /DNA_ID=CAMNT_0027548593 /DNA_START=92 /DNA_END=724 /DNA_ORIENTATION=-